MITFFSFFFLHYIFFNCDFGSTDRTNILKFEEKTLGGTGCKETSHDLRVSVSKVRICEIKPDMITIINYLFSLSEGSNMEETWGPFPNNTNIIFN